MMERILIVFLAFVALCYGHSFKMRGCPKVKVMKDFDMDKFTGEWFVIARFNPITRCLRLGFDKSEEGVYTVKESSKTFGFHFGTENSPRKGRKITIMRNDTDAIFKVEKRLYDFIQTTHGIVETDYENYAVVWGCDSAFMGSIRNLDILSRTPDIKEGFIKEAVEKASAAGIDVNPLKKVDNSKCADEEEDAEDDEKRGFNNMFI